MILKDFLDTNYKKLRLSESLTKLTEQHSEASNILITRYNLDQSLAAPIVEYGQYVLTKGSDEEKRNMLLGIENTLILMNDKLRLSHPAARIKQNNS